MRDKWNKKVKVGNFMSKWYQQNKKRHNPSCQNSTSWNGKLPKHTNTYTHLSNLKLVQQHPQKTKKTPQINDPLLLFWVSKQEKTKTTLYSLDSLTLFFVLKKKDNTFNLSLFYSFFFNWKKSTRKIKKRGKFQ